MSDTLETEHSPAGPAVSEAERPTRRFRWARALQAAPTRRTLLLTALGGLIIAGLAVAIPAFGTGAGPLAGYIYRNSAQHAGAKSIAAFNHAKAGDCLMWPDAALAAASIVNCTDDHKFEVAQAVDLRTFPGAEYAPNAAPPSPARIQQISQEQCDAAVRGYLGAKLDPNSKFSVSMLWSGDRAWRQTGDRRMLCGLQLPGPNNQQAISRGRVAAVDQSKVWPTGTCLGIDLATNQPIDVAVDCAAPHAMEITGTVDVAEKFPAAFPSEPDQDGFIKDSCTKMTDTYLGPVKLRTTTLTLIYPTVSLPSWSADNREVACSIGATLGSGNWATLVNSAKGKLLINGLPPVPPPDIPESRLAPTPIQVPEPGDSPDPIPPNNQHLPQQPAAIPQRPETVTQHAPQPATATQHAPQHANATQQAPPANPAPAPAQPLPPANPAPAPPPAPLPLPANPAPAPPPAPLPVPAILAPPPPPGAPPPPAPGH